MHIRLCLCVDAFLQMVLSMEPTSLQECVHAVFHGEDAWLHPATSFYMQPVELKVKALIGRRLGSFSSKPLRAKQRNMGRQYAGWVWASVS